MSGAVQRSSPEPSETRALEQLFAAMVAKLEIDERYVIGKASRKKPQAKELSPVMKVRLWRAACELLVRNSSLKPEQDDHRTAGSFFPGRGEWGGASRFDTRPGNPAPSKNLHMASPDTDKLVKGASDK
jgi:hypothetical protein